MKQKVNLIVAMDESMGIGKNNSLPWHIPADMKFFKEMTQNSTVIMGRKNWESIPEKYRPLPNRRNIVLTRNPDYQVPNNVLTADSIESALAFSSADMPIFVIGGGEIYEEVLNKDLVDVMFITHIHDHFNCDVHFPEFEMENWDSEEFSQYLEKDGHTEIFVVVMKYIRKPRLYKFPSRSGLTLLNSTAEERIEAHRRLEELGYPMIIKTEQRKAKYFDECELIFDEPGLKGYWSLCPTGGVKTPMTFVELTAILNEFHS